MSPDGGFNWGLVVPPPTSPPTPLYPIPTRAQAIVDAWAVYLADPQGNLIGVPQVVPPTKWIQATRTSTAGNL